EGTSIAAVEAGGKDVRFGREGTQHLFSRFLIVERQGSSSIYTEGVGQGGEFTNGTRTVVLALVDAESEGSEQDREGAGGEDQEYQVGPNREVPNVHRLTLPFPPHRQESLKRPGAAAGS